MNEFKLKSILTEKVSYTPPKNLDVVKKGLANPKVLTAARQLFYDFYAIRYLHNKFGNLGPSNKPTQYTSYLSALNDPNKQKGEEDGDSGYTNVGAIQDPSQGNPMPYGFRKTIDELYEQITKMTALNLIRYLRMSLLQEFRYFLNVTAWNSFRQSLVTKYNSKIKFNQPFTKQDFVDTIRAHLSGMVGHTDSVVRLLKFNKVYKDGDSVKAIDSKTGYDIAVEAGVVSDLPNWLDQPSAGDAGIKGGEPKNAYKSGYTPTAKQPWHKKHSDKPVDPRDPIDPDWDVVNKPTDDVPEEPEGEDIPDYPDYEEPKTLQPGEDPWAHKKKKKSVDELLNEYASATLTPKLILRCQAAAKKAGLTWEDMDRAYNNIHWGGSFGGKKWGTGSTALLKLLPILKQGDPEALAEEVDHVWDLVHNTGPLLNKGGMHVNQLDLDRRGNMSNPALFLGDVSPQIAKLINVVMRYLPGDPEINKNLLSYTNKPSHNLTPEQEQLLFSVGFKSNTDIHGTFYRGKYKFYNKQDELDTDKYYDFRALDMGVYSVCDDMVSDVQVFKTWDEAKQWVENFKHKSVMSKPSSSTPPPKDTLTAIQQYIASRTKIKLSPYEEEKLLNIKYGWRSKGGSQYYKAYFSGSDRMYFLAFSDGTFMVSSDMITDGNTYDNFNTAFTNAEIASQTALPYPEKDAAQAEIDKAKAISLATEKSPQVFGTVPDEMAQQLISTAIQAKLPQGVMFKLDKLSVGSMNYIRITATATANVFKDAAATLCYISVIHPPQENGAAIEVQTYSKGNHNKTNYFNTWKQCTDYLEGYLVGWIPQNIGTVSPDPSSNIVIDSVPSEAMQKFISDSIQKKLPPGLSVNLDKTHVKNNVYLKVSIDVLGDLKRLCYVSLMNPPTADGASIKIQTVSPNIPPTLKYVNTWMQCVGYLEGYLPTWISQNVEASPLIPPSTSTPSQFPSPLVQGTPVPLSINEQEQIVKMIQSLLPSSWSVQMQDSPTGHSIFSANEDDGDTVPILSVVSSKIPKLPTNYYSVGLKFPSVGQAANAGFDKWNNVMDFVQESVSNWIFKIISNPFKDCQYLSKNEIQELIPLIHSKLPSGWTVYVHNFADSDAGWTRFYVKRIDDKKILCDIAKYISKKDNDLMSYAIKSYVGKASIELKTWSNSKQYMQSLAYELSKTLPSSGSGGVVASQTPSLYAKKHITVPNSPSVASYSAHVGINTTPTKTIRLTVEDEKILESAGFAPAIFKSDVYYSHLTVKDVVMFYPNNFAKLTFNKGGGKVNLKISEMIAWIKSKYTASTAESPSTVPASKTAKTGYSGKKLPSMFEKHVTGIGFAWDAQESNYKDNPYNILTVYPSLNSELKIYKGDHDNSPVNSYKFNTLPELVGFLGSTYPSVKSNGAPPEPPPSSPPEPTEPPVTPGPTGGGEQEITELIDMLKDHDVFDITGKDIDENITKKVEAIKMLREFMHKKGFTMGLAGAKSAIENFPEYIAHCMTLGGLVTHMNYTNKPKSYKPLREILKATGFKNVDYKDVSHVHPSGYKVIIHPNIINPNGSSSKDYGLVQLFDKNGNVVFSTAKYSEMGTLIESKFQSDMTDDTIDESKHTSIQKGYEIASEIRSTLGNYVPNNDGVSSTFQIHGSVHDAVKDLYNIIVSEPNGIPDYHPTIKNCEYAVKHIDHFIKYISTHGIPDMTNKSDIEVPLTKGYTFDAQASMPVLDVLTHLFTGEKLFTGQAFKLNMDKKVAAIRTFINLFKKFNKNVSLANAKYIVENFPAFIEYSQAHGIPDLSLDMTSVLSEVISNKSPYDKLKHTLAKLGYKNITVPQAKPSTKELLEDSNGNIIIFHNADAGGGVHLYNKSGSLLFGAQYYAQMDKYLNSSFSVPNAEAEPESQPQSPLAKFIPSDTEYKKTNSMANADYIRLNKHDENILNNCGFKWTPQENQYYKSDKGDIAIFTTYGNSYLHLDGGVNKEFSSISEAMQYIILVFLKTEGDKSYNTAEKDGVVEYILPFTKDLHLLNSMGFVCDTGKYKSCSKQYGADRVFFNVLNSGQSEIIVSKKDGTFVPTKYFPTVSSGLVHLAILDKEMMKNTSGIKTPDTKTSPTKQQIDELLVTKLGLEFSPEKTESDPEHALVYTHYIDVVTIQVYDNGNDKIIYHFKNSKGEVLSYKFNTWSDFVKFVETGEKTGISLTKSDTNIPALFYNYPLLKEYLNKHGLESAVESEADLGIRVTARIPGSKYIFLINYIKLGGSCQVINKYDNTAYYMSIHDVPHHIKTNSPDGGDENDGNDDGTDPVPPTTDDPASEVTEESQLDKVLVESQGFEKTKDGYNKKISDKLTFSVNKPSHKGNGIGLYLLNGTVGIGYRQYANVQDALTDLNKTAVEDFNLVSNEKMAVLGFMVDDRGVYSNLNKPANPPYEEIILDCMFKGSGRANVKVMGNTSNKQNKILTNEWFATHAEAVKWISQNYPVTEEENLITINKFKDDGFTGAFASDGRGLVYKKTKDALEYQITIFPMSMMFYAKKDGENMGSRYWNNTLDGEDYIKDLGASKIELYSSLHNADMLDIGFEFDGNSYAYTKKVPSYLPSYDDEILLVFRFISDGTCIFTESIAGTGDPSNLTEKRFESFPEGIEYIEQEGYKSIPRDTENPNSDFLTSYHGKILKELLFTEFPSVNPGAKEYRKTIGPDLQQVVQLDLGSMWLTLFSGGKAIANKNITPANKVIIASPAKTKENIDNTLLFPIFSKTLNKYGFFSDDHSEEPARYIRKDQQKIITFKYELWFLADGTAQMFIDKKVGVGNNSISNTGDDLYSPIEHATYSSHMKLLDVIQDTFEPKNHPTNMDEEIVSKKDFYKKLMREMYS